MKTSPALRVSPFTKWLSAKSISPACLIAALALPALHAAPIQISTTPVSGGDVLAVGSITADSAYATYIGDLTTDGINEIYTASTTATGTQFKINTTPLSGGITTFAFPTDPNRIIFVGALNTIAVAELYGASTTTAGTQVKLSSTPVAGGNVLAAIFAPDGSRAVYRGDLDTDGTFEIYGASPTASGTQIKLNTTPVAGGAVNSFFNVTPDSTRAIYTGGLITADVLEIFSASTSSAGTQIKLNNTPVSGGDIPNSFTISPNSARVLYRGDLTTDGTTELYSASTTTADTEIKLNDTPVTNGNVASLAISADSTRVVYSGDLTEDGVNELYSSSTTASTQITLSDEPVSGGNVGGYVLTQDSARVVYSGDLDTDGVTELYSASINAADTQIKLNETPVSGGTISTFTINFDGSRAVYRGDLTTDDINDLYVATTNTTGSQLNLSNLTGSDDVGSSIVISPDNAWVAYTVVSGTTNSLWITAMDGSTDPVMLNSPAAWDITIGSVQFTPDSQTICYRSDESADEVFSAYSVAVPGAMPTPTPTPTPAPTKPVVTVTVLGKKSIKTTAAKVVIKGTAKDTGGTLGSVQAKVGKAAYKKAKGTTSWSFTAKLKPGKNTVLIQAFDVDGTASSTVTVKVTRK
ncbi:MAG: hypothetical protein ACREKL_01285 [Chthoniobacterales bacterium]